MIENGAGDRTVGCAHHLVDILRQPCPDEERPGEQLRRDEPRLAPAPFWVVDAVNDGRPQQLERERP